MTEKSGPSAEIAGQGKCHGLPFSLTPHPEHLYTDSKSTLLISTIISCFLDKYLIPHCLSQHLYLSSFIFPSHRWKSPKAFQFQAHSCLVAELVQIKTESISAASAPPGVGPGVNHGCPQTWYQLYLAYALDANLASRAHHFLSFFQFPFPRPSHIQPQVWVRGAAAGYLDILTFKL